jgi:hypothetical protein
MTISSPISTLVNKYRETLCRYVLASCELSHSLTCCSNVSCRLPDLAKRVGRVYTFGAPRIGDAEFCRGLEKAFPGRVFRYVHACDMVTKLPAGFGYQHHALERFITSYPLSHGSR